MLTLLLALSVATWAGAITMAGDVDPPCDLGGWLLLLFVPVGPICVACLQIWGFLHVGLIMWLLFMLVHEDAPRLRMAAFAFLPQFLCTVIAFGVFVSFDGWMALRLAIATPVAALVTASPFLAQWARARHHQPRHS